jgi:serine phosphatase RsbU (regulator of sigma subunit)
MWVGTIDLSARRVVYAGVGNVDALLWQHERRVHLVGQRGIVGAALPTLRPYTQELVPGWLLMVHTDGIRAGVGTDGLPADHRDDPQGLVNDVLQEWARDTDDALVVTIQAA